MEDYEDYNYDTECGSGCVSGQIVVSALTTDDTEEDNYDTDGRN